MKEKLTERGRAFMECFYGLEFDEIHKRDFPKVKKEDLIIALNCAGADEDDIVQAILNGMKRGKKE